MSEEKFLGDKSRTEGVLAERSGETSDCEEKVTMFIICLFLFNPKTPQPGLKDKIHVYSLMCAFSFKIIGII